jgi:hypothetical protein
MHFLLSLPELLSGPGPAFRPFIAERPDAHPGKSGSGIDLIRLDSHYIVAPLA